jgi:hypothetical protein
LFFEDLANKKYLNKSEISLDRNINYLHLCSPQKRKRISGCELKKADKNNKK